MATFIYSTTKNFKGPWLLDEERLRAFDRMFDEQWTAISTKHEKDIKAHVEDEVQNLSIEASVPKKIKQRSSGFRQEAEERWRATYRTVKPNITVTFKDGKRSRVKKFEELFDDPATEREVATGFHASFVSGPVECDITLRRSKNPLTIAVSPEGNEDGRLLFQAIQKWARDSEAPKWQQVWRSAVPYVWVISILAIFVLAVIFVPGAGRAKEEIRAQAQELAQQGVTDSTKIKALQLILAVSSGYSPPDAKRAVPEWFIVGGITAFGLCVLLSILPTAHLGIGRGNVLIDRWRTWMKIMGIVIPGYIVLPFLINMLSSR